MSNIFITDIVGSGTYAVPTDDTELAAATSGLDTLLSGVLNLAYDRVLAWVEDSGGPGGAEGTRSLNCLVEKFTYLTDECPSESEVDTMIAAIEAALEADANITSVGNQQVHIFQAGAYFLWNRDASGGFLYPNTATDDVAVGPFATPTGKWFDDGDMVLGAAAMSGTEKLRVAGSQRIDTNGQLLIADSATIPPLNITERSAAPSAPSAGDIYLDDGTNTGSTSPGWRRCVSTGPSVWEDLGALASSGVSQWNEQNIVHVAPHGNDSNNGDAINLAKLTIASAITRATALTPTATNRITILIHPGEYDDGITTADSYVDFIGIDRETCILKPTSTQYIYVTDNNVRIANITLDKTSSSSNFSLRVNAAIGVYIDSVRVIMDGDSNDEVNLIGLSDVTFRDCIFEDSASDANLIMDGDTSRGTYRFINCTFKGYISISNNNYFTGCYFESSAFTPITLTGTSPDISRMIGCVCRRTGGTGQGIYLSTASADFGIIGCDIAFATAGNPEILTNSGVPAYISGNIIGTWMGSNVDQKGNARRLVANSGGIDVYSDLQDAIDSLPAGGGIVELMEDIDVGSTTIDTVSTEHVIIEGNGFTITGTQSIEASTGSVLQIRNVKLDGLYAHLRYTSSTLHLKNVQILGSGNKPCVNVGSTTTSSSKLILDNVDADATSQASLNALFVNSSGAPGIHINDSSFTGRNVSGSGGAAVYFAQAGAVFRAINSLFVHQVGGVSDYEIDANTAVTVYTQYCMTRANAIGAAANVTEGISTNYNIVDANAGFLWRE